MRYLFEDYALDTYRCELRRGALLVSIEPQVFDLLAYLIRNRDRVVSKDDLLAAIWKGRVVSETALTSRINSARSAIGDNGQQQRLIKTLLRKGVRFVGPVREEQEHAAEAAVQSTFALDRLLDRPSIAVLPFTNMSGDAEQEYFADGIVEEIITALAHLRWLSVIARNSSFAYKGRSVDVKQVGREFGVRYVLEGSVRKSASRIRIAAQLIEAASGVHLWANRFDGSLEDIFDLQDQITLAALKELRAKRAAIDRASVAMEALPGLSDSVDFLGQFVELNAILERSEAASATASVRHVQIRARQQEQLLAATPPPQRHRA